MAYKFLFTLAPGLLFLWHLLGLFGTDPATLHKMLAIVRAFLPPDPKVQEILDSVVANVIVTGNRALPGERLRHGRHYCARVCRR